MLKSGPLQWAPPRSATLAVATAGALDEQKGTSMRRVSFPVLECLQSGYFSQADPKAPVVAYRPRGSGDPLEKGGRYSEEFIWNTKWQDALKYDEDVKRQIEEAKVGLMGDAGATPRNVHVVSHIALPGEKALF